MDISQKNTCLKNRGINFLHVAPEYCFSKYFHKKFYNYLTADLYSDTVMVKMDITDIKYPDESFELIIANHVLEHVSDDLKAMKELYRVLSKNGFAILMVPQTKDAITFEDFSITNPKERAVAFGQDDHVRRYGQDYSSRLEKAGFNVKVIRANDLLSDNKISKYSCGHNGDVFACTK